MIPPMEAVKKILWGNVILDGVKVPVIKRSYPYDKTPCITIDDSGGSKFIQRYITSKLVVVDENHPSYNPDAPLVKIPQQIIRECYSTNININVWANSIDEQEKLNNIISDLFYKVQSDYYLFCKQYDDGYCKSVNDSCYACTCDLDKRSVKNQCPNPEEYGYENIFSTYNLIRSSFFCAPAFNLEDRSREEIVYHSILRLTTAYYIDYIIGGLMNTGVDGNILLG